MRQAVVVLSVSPDDLQRGRTSPPAPPAEFLELSRACSVASEPLASIRDRTFDIPCWPFPPISYTISYTQPAIASTSAGSGNCPFLSRDPWSVHSESGRVKTAFPVSGDMVVPCPPNRSIPARPHPHPRRRKGVAHSMVKPGSVTTSFSNGCPLIPAGRVPDFGNFTAVRQPPTPHVAKFAVPTPLQPAPSSATHFGGVRQARGRYHRATRLRPLSTRE